MEINQIARDYLDKAYNENEKAGLKRFYEYLDKTIKNPENKSIKNDLLNNYLSEIAWQDFFIRESDLDQSNKNTYEEKIKDFSFLFKDYSASETNEFLKNAYYENDSLNSDILNDILNELKLPSTKIDFKNGILVDFKDKDGINKKTILQKIDGKSFNYKDGSLTCSCNISNLNPESFNKIYKIVEKEIEKKGLKLEDTFFYSSFKDKITNNVDLNNQKKIDGQKFILDNFKFLVKKTFQNDILNSPVNSNFLESNISLIETYFDALNTKFKKSATEYVIDESSKGEINSFLLKELLPESIQKNMSNTKDLKGQEFER